MDIDILILGAGVAGLRAAEQAVKAGVSAAICSSGGMASPRVIGFNAPVAPDDSPELFLRDILDNSAGVGRKDLAETLAYGAASCVRELEDEGLVFDRNPDGGFHLLRPLGCSVPRLVHCGNVTAKRYLDAAVGRLPKVLDFYALDLLMKDGAVCGAAGIMDGEVVTIRAKAVVLAVGGGGGIFTRTTYPAECVGSGYAMAYRAGARLRDMEFVQFEPCRCARHPIGLSTTLLEKGGKILNSRGERFILPFAPAGEGSLSKAELAQRVARELRKNEGGVWLDLRDLPKSVIQIDHALYDRRLRQVGIDLVSEPVEIAPVAHTFLGGVEIEPDGSTSLPGLFAAGEVAGGIHGANRIGGNAGTEIFLFGAIAGRSAVRYAGTVKTVPDAVFRAPFGAGAAAAEDHRERMARLRAVADDALFVICSGAGLRRALAALEAMEREPVRVDTVEALRQCYEWKNALLTTRMVVEASLRRTGTLGVFCREDDAAE